MSNTMIDEAMTISNEKEDKNANTEILEDIRYICKSTALITDSLRNGCDIAQLPNGDIMITEIKTIHLHYTWDKNKEKMVRLS
jgi:hypothetical protein